MICEHEWVYDNRESVRDCINCSQKQIRQWVSVPKGCKIRYD